MLHWDHMDGKGSMRVVYNDLDNGKTLGSLEYTDIPTALLPNLFGNSHSVFSQHQFSGESNIHWKVISITHDESVITVDLSSAPLKRASFGTHSVVKGLKPSTKPLKPWTIARVDFSHHSECHQLGQNPQPNQEYLTSRLPGELHKLRPCIILNCSQDTTQVIPLSTKSYNAKVSSSIALSESSFNTLAPNMREDTSYALLHMITTVSSFRVYPLDGANGHQLDYNKQQVVSPSDKQSIEAGLAVFFSPKIKQQITVKDQQIQSKTNEIRGLKSRQVTDDQRYQQIKDKLCVAEKFISNLASEMGIKDGELDTVIEELSSLLNQK